MAKKAKPASCCGASGYQVEAVITVDERGQMVLPKDVRAKTGIQPGEKLALVTCEQGDGACCLILIKTDQLLSMVRQALGPIVAQLNG